MADVWVGALLGMSAGPLIGIGQARADNAFPDSQAVLLPRDRLDEIVLATTFGLLFTEDGGSRWTYACEADLTAMRDFPGQYVLGPPPLNRIHAVGDLGVLVSNDGACSWARGGGALIPAPPLQLPQLLDVFPDPTDPMRVFVLAADPQTMLVSAHRSDDGGLTYGGAIYTSPPNATVTGIESATSSPGTVYVTFYETPGFHPRLAASRDWGETWTTTDIETGVGAAIPRLAAVDAADERTIYLRMMSGAGEPDQYEALALTSDAGATWTVPVKLPGGSLVGFAKLADGTLLAVGAAAGVGPDGLSPPVLLRSENGGQSFTSEGTAFHSFGLAARGNTAFVATKDNSDGFALASSTDRGRSWVPRLAFREIDGVKECVRATCQQACDYFGGIQLFPASVCNPPADGGHDDASSDLVGGGGSGGCGCGLVDPARFGTAGAANALAILALLAGAAFLTRVRDDRTRQPGRAPAGSLKRR